MRKVRHRTDLMFLMDGPKSGKYVNCGGTVYMIPFATQDKAFDTVVFSTIDYRQVGEVNLRLMGTNRVIDRVKIMSVKNAPYHEWLVMDGEITERATLAVAPMRDEMVLRMVREVVFAIQLKRRSAA